MNSNFLFIIFILFSLESYSQIIRINEMESMTIGEIYCQYKDSIVYVEQINGFGNPYNVSVLLGLKSDSTYYIGLNIRYTNEELEQSINKEWYDDIYPLGNLLFRIPDNIYIRNKNRKPDNKIIKFR